MSPLSSAHTLLSSSVLLFLSTMKFSLGPFELRCYSGSNWSNLELAFVTARKGGCSQRETAVKTGFKSEHLIEVFGEDNPADTLKVGDVTYTGKVVPGFDGEQHVITAEQVAARAQRAEAIRAANKAGDKPDSGDAGPAAA